MQGPPASGLPTPGRWTRPEAVTPRLCKPATPSIVWAVSALRSVTGVASSSTGQVAQPRGPRHAPMPNEPKPIEIITGKERRQRYSAEQKLAMVEETM